MNALIAIYFVLHGVLFGTVGWLLALPQIFVWRIVLGVIQFGTLWNLAGLLWLGYDRIWPGEPVIAAGFCLVMLGLWFLRAPLVTHRRE